MDKASLLEWRDYVWKYFIAYAEARLSTFRFYLVFCTILIAGLAANFSNTQEWFAVVLCLLLSFLSFIYWKIDVRHKHLIDHAIEALEYLEAKLPLPENEGKPHPIQVFLSEAERSKKYDRFPAHFSPKAYFTYAICVNLVFSTIGLGGLVVAFAIIVA